MADNQQAFTALAELSARLKQIHKKEIIETENALNTLKQNIMGLDNLRNSDCKNRLKEFSNKMQDIAAREFSFLKTFSLEDNELVHSSFLAWLLDPTESHQAKGFFTKEFLKLVTRDNPFDFSGINLEEIKVEREVSSDHSRLDIRFYDPLMNFQCIIENKIWSGEGTDQTNRLYTDFHNAKCNELFVFLTLTGARPQNPNFIIATYRELISVLRKTKTVANGDAKFLINHYINTIERLVMSETFEGYSEKTLLYYHYYRFIDEVKKSFEKDRQLLLSTIEAEIKRQVWWTDAWQIERYGGDINVWKKSWYLEKNKGVYLQLYPHIEDMGFSIRSYVESSEFARELVPFMKKIIDEKYPGKEVGKFRKTFSNGVSRFAEKRITFLPSEKDQVEKIIGSVNEAAQLFEPAIEKSLLSVQKKPQ